MKHVFPMKFHLLFVQLMEIIFYLYDFPPPIVQQHSDEVQLIFNLIISSGK